MPAILKKPEVSAKEDKKPNKRTRRATAKTDRLNSRQVIFPTVHAVVHLDNPQEGQQPPITADLAKEILGWEEETSEKPFGNRYLLKLDGVKVRCMNNVTNRPLFPPNLETYKQETLRRRWRLNGEPIIVGRTGLVLNGQHSLIQLILAAKEWNENPSKWPNWETEPVMSKLIVFGVDEDDETVNTMDTCKPRSLWEVIYRAPYFRDLQKDDHRKASKLADDAIKMLWLRTGTHSNAFAMRRTHAESIDFLSRHERVLEAVRHIYEEDGVEKKVTKYLKAGYASAMLYLMGTSATLPEDYYQADSSSENLLDFSRWDTASKFFVELAQGTPGFKPVRDYLDKLMSEGAGEVGFKVRWAILARAWSLYVEGKTLTAKNLALEFQADEDGAIHLVEHPLLEGIDVGDEGLPFATNTDPKKEDIVKKAENLRAKRYAVTKAASKRGQTWAKGDKAWVHDKGEDAYFATLSDDPFPTANGIEHVFVTDEEDREWDVPVMNLSLKQYEMA